MEDGDTESENASRVIQDFVFLCRKIGSINGYFLQVYNKFFISDGIDIFSDYSLSPDVTVLL